MPQSPAPPWAAAALRNREPILGFLKSILPSTLLSNPPTTPILHALECACGTGAHMQLNAAAFPGLLWHPTDLTPAEIALEALAGANVLEPQRLDTSVSVRDWPPSVVTAKGAYALVMAVNMVHIAPPPATTGLLRGAADLLAPDGLLVLYGPFFEANVATAPGNIAFDEALRARDPQWGVRRLEDVCAEAREFGLVVWRRQEMPANNLCVALRRMDTESGDS
jgi:SAM-dependent methyltransferase